MRGASKAALREQLRVRSFRNVLLVTSLVMTLIAVGVAGSGFPEHHPRAPVPWSR
jgi:hypothetical protein